MNRILLSIATIAVVGAGAAGATGAFYSDTETSEGNIFTAGSIDLQIDHTLATYNDFVCQDGAWVTSGSAVWEEVWQIGDVDAPLANPYDEFNYSGSVDVAGYSEPFVTPFVVGTTPTSEWPWNSDSSRPYADDLDIDFTYGGLIPVTARLVIGWSPGKSGSEVNEVRIDYDSTPVGTLSRSGSTDNSFWDGYPRYQDTIEFAITSGSHTLNLLQTQGNGILWDYVRLEILPGSVGTCSLFDQQDLDGSSFFTFGDVKPGDEGRNVISLHVSDNDAHACLIAHDGADDENTVLETELPDDDSAGELQDYINVFAWHDVDGDGEYESGETGLGQSTLGNIGTIAALDSTSGLYLTSTTTEYVGLAWCAGTLSVSTTAITCNGDGMPNVAQTDVYSASLTAYAEQLRNNTGFLCSGVDLGSGGGSQNVYFNGFEINTEGWNDYLGGTITRVASGNNGVSSADGGYHAIVERDYPFTRWGGYSSTFPTGGYTTEVDVYIDMNTVAATSGDPYFEFSSAANGSDGNHQRDFIFHVGHDTAGGDWSATVSNNSTHPSSPQPDTPHLTNQVGGTVTPIAITQTGWYTLQSYFHDNGGVLAVDMNIVNESGTTVASWTLSSPLDTIPAEVGGNRYGWFTQQPFAFLAVDNSRMYLGAPN